MTSLLNPSAAPSTPGTPSDSGVPGTPGTPGDSGVPGVPVNDCNKFSMFNIVMTILAVNWVVGMIVLAWILAFEHEQNIIKIVITFLFGIYGYVLYVF